MTFLSYPFFIYLPSKPQAEWHRYEERMLRAISLKTAAIAKVIEHVRFQIQAERLEYLVLHTGSQVDGPLAAGLDVAPQRE